MWISCYVVAEWKLWDWEFKMGFWCRVCILRYQKKFKRGWKYSGEVGFWGLWWGGICTVEVFNCHPSKAVLGICFLIFFVHPFVLHFTVEKPWVFAMKLYAIWSLIEMDVWLLLLFPSNFICLVSFHFHLSLAFVLMQFRLPRPIALNFNTGTTNATLAHD